jgi:hypothetical protein
MAEKFPAWQKGTRQREYPMHRFKPLPALVAVVSYSTPAAAGCFEGVGCTHNERLKEANLRPLNCENLWFVRNAIYAENGYCFKTELAISAFGNDNCRFANIGEVPLNKYEHYNVALIQKVEGRKGC